MSHLLAVAMPLTLAKLFFGAHHQTTVDSREAVACSGGVEHATVLQGEFNFF
jgi:hypothetical protein